MFKDAPEMRQVTEAGEKMAFGNEANRRQLTTYNIRRKRAVSLIWPTATQSAK